MWEFVSGKYLYHLKFNYSFTPVWLCILSSFVSAQTLVDPNLRITELVGGLSQPTAMAFIGPHDLLVLQKGDGRVRRVTNGVLQTGAVLDVNVDNASERGLLGIAVHPDFSTTSLVYVYYTESSAPSDTSGDSDAQAPDSTSGAASASTEAGASAPTPTPADVGAPAEAGAFFLARRRPGAPGLSLARVPKTADEAGTGRARSCPPSSTGG